jgi:GST-like protein
LKVLDGQLDGQDWIVGDFSIADIATAPWVGTLVHFYKAHDLAGWDDLRNVPAWLDRFMERPGVQRGATVPAES